MKKFLSYILVFCMMFAISLTVTVRVKSDFLAQQQLATTAQASGQASFLSGMMESFEKNPKINVGGNISLSLNEKDIDISIDANIDLTTLTNPDVQANLTIKYDQKEYDLFATYVAGAIYLSYNNVNIKASIDGINDAIDSIKQFVGEIEMPETNMFDGLLETFSNIDTQMLINALTDPIKQAVGEYYQYTIELDGICTLIMMADEKCNLSSVVIQDFVLSDNVDVYGELFIMQDDNINIVEPSQDNYLDIATAIESVGELLTEDYIYLQTNASIYKNGSLFEYAKATAKLDMLNQKYNIEAKLKGYIAGDLSISYIGDKLYAKLNDMGICASKETILSVIGIIVQNINISMPQIDIDFDELLMWLKNNYDSLLENTEISNKLIKLKLDLSNFVAGLDNLSVVVEFSNNKIYAIKIDGLAVDDYLIRLNCYISTPEYLPIEIEEQDYFDASTIFDLIETINQNDRFAFDGRVQANIGEKEFSFDLSAIFDKSNGSFDANIDGLLGQDIEVGYVSSQILDNPMYLRINDICLSARKEYIKELLSGLFDNIELPTKEQLKDLLLTTISKYDISDLLKLANITIDSQKIELDIDLSILVGKTCKISTTLVVGTDKVEIQSLNFEYDQIKINLSMTAQTTDNHVVINNQNDYVDVELLIENLQNYIDCNNLFAQINLQLSLGEQNITFEGNVGAQLYDNNFVLEGRTNILEDNLFRLVYLNGRAYVEFGEQHYQMSLDTLAEILLSKDIDISPYLSKVREVLNFIKTLNINELIKDYVSNIDFSNDINISNIIETINSIESANINEILGLLSNIQFKNNKLIFVGEIAGISFDTQIKFASKTKIDLTVSMQDTSAMATIAIACDSANYSVDQDSINIDNAQKEIVDILQIIENDKFEGTAQISLGTESYKNIDVQYKLFLADDNIKAQAVLTVCGQEIFVAFENQTIYIDFQGIHVSCTIDQIKEILTDEFVSNALGIDIDFEEIFDINLAEVLPQLLDFANNNTIINNLYKQDGKLFITLFDQINLALQTETNSLSAWITYNEISSEISLTANENIEFTQIDANNYVSATDLFDLAKNIYNYVVAQEYYITLNATYGDYAITGYIGYDADGLVAQVSTELYGQQIVVTVLNRTIYIDALNLKLSLALDNAAELIARINTKFELGLDADTLDLISNILNCTSIEQLLEATTGLDIELDIAELLNNIELSLTLNNLAVTYGDISAEVAFANNNISTISASYADLIAELNVTEKQNIAVSGEYVDLAELYNTVENVYDYVLAQQFYIELNLTYKDYEITGYVGYDADGLVAQVSTELYGQQVVLTILNRTIYVDALNLKLSLAFEDISTLVERINTKFELGLNADTLELISNLLNCTGIEQLLEATSGLDIELDIEQLLAYITLSLTLNNLSVVYGDISAEIVFANNNISTISAVYTDLVAELNITEKQNIAVSGEYVDLAELYNTAENVYDYIFGEEYYITLNATYGNYAVTGYLGYDADGLVAQISTELYGQNITITVLNRTIYVDALNLKLSLALDNAAELIARINTKFELGLDADTLELISNLLNCTSIADMLEIATDLDFELDIEQLLADITLSLTLNNLSVVYGDISAEIAFANNNISTISASYADLVAELNVTEKQNIAVGGEYVDLAELYNTAENVYDYIFGEEYYITLNATYGEYSVTGYVSYDADGLVAQISTELYGQQVVLTILNRTVYASIGGLKVKLTFAQVAELFEEIIEQFEIDVDANIIETVTTILTADELDLKELIGELASIFDIDIQSMLQEVELGLSLDGITINYNDFSIAITFANNNISAISAEYLDLLANVSIAEKQTIEIVDSNYTNISGITNLLGTIKGYIEQKTFAGTFSLTYDEWTISGDMQLSFEDNIIKLELVWDFYGFRMKVAFIEDTLYIGLDDIKVKISKDEIDDLIGWINSAFDQEIEFSASDLDNIDIAELAGKLDLSKIVLSIVQSTISIAYGEDLNLSATLDDSIDLTFSYKLFSGEFELSPAQTTFDIQPSEYQSYTILTDLVDAVLKVLEDKKMTLSAVANVYEGTSLHYVANCAVSVDLSNNKLAVQLNISIQDKFTNKTHTIMATSYGGYWYIYYNNLKLKIVEADFNELLAIVLKIIGIDLSKLPFDLGIIPDISDINTTRLAAFLPNITLSDPLELLEYVKNLRIVDGALVCDIDASMVTDNPNATDMSLVIATSGGALSSITATNLYTGRTNGEHMNLSANVTSYVPITLPANSSKYIDISGSNNLIKAFLNTAELKYFNVSGTISAELYGLSLANVPVILQVDATQDGNPTIFVQIDFSGLSSIITSVLFEDHFKKDHIVRFYYKDSYLYIYTTATYTSWFKTYYSGKKLKAHIESVLDDPMYYLKYALSFSSTIENQIDSSIESTADHEIDLGNIIKSYSSNGGQYQATLNMKELSGSNKLGDMDLTITTINNASTSHRNYLGSLSFNIELSFGLTVDLTGNNFQLINIGQTINFASINSFINNYSYAEGVEASYDNQSSSYSASNWSTSAGKQYTMTFNTNGGSNVSSIKAHGGAAITLPTPTKVENVGGNRYEYEFLGWWKDSTLVKEQYTDSTMAHKNITLYAKWQLDKVYTTIYYYLDGNLINTTQKLVGSPVLTLAELGLSADRVVTDSSHKYYQSYVGIFDTNNNPISAYGENSINVNVVYQTTLTLNLHTITVNTGVAPSVGALHVYNTEQFMSLLPVYTTYAVVSGDTQNVYMFDGWYLNNTFTISCTDQMPDNNITVYAKWNQIERYTTIYYYLDDNLINTTQKLVGSPVLTLAELGLSVDRVVTDSSHKYYQSYVGIFDTNNNPISAYGENSINVNVVYQTTNTLNLHTVTIDAGVAPAVEGFNAYNTEALLSRLPQYNQTIEKYFEDEKVMRTYEFAGWYFDNLFTDACTSQMPDRDITAYAKWIVINEVHTYSITIYDNNQIVYQELITEGDNISLPGTITVLNTTQWYLDSAYTNQTTYSSIMASHDVVLHIRNQYTYTVTYYTKSGTTYVSNTTTTAVYQGATISLPTQTNDTIYTNSNNQKDIYTFSGYKEGSTSWTSTTMPNRNLTISSQMSITTQYKVTFVTNTTYTMTHKYGITYTVTLQNANYTPSAVYVTSGQSLTVSTCYTNGTPTRKGTYKLKVFGTVKTVNYTVDSWSKTDSGTGGQASWTITAPTTLYAVWKEV